MIALCATHHAKVAGFTKAQLRDMKRGSTSPADVSGRFDWMREDVLGVVGGNLFVDVPEMIHFKRRKIIWFERDTENRMLLNLSAPSPEPRATLINNDWTLGNDVADVESPPHGAFLRVRYLNGDDVSIRFREWASQRSLARLYPMVSRLDGQLAFPLVTAEVTLTLRALRIRMTPSATFGVRSTAGRNIVMNTQFGMNLDA
jgi:hypothetical protein